jgi:hypothetical protein
VQAEPDLAAASASWKALSAEAESSGGGKEKKYKIALLLRITPRLLGRVLHVQRMHWAPLQKACFFTAF